MSDTDTFQDEAYFDPARGRRSFDSDLLRESANALPTRKPLIFSPEHSVTEAIRAMQGEHRGCVLVTSDGTPASRVTGIFTERDVLFRIVDRGRNPAVLPLGEVMSPDPECLNEEEPMARVLNMMSVGGFRHVPIVDGRARPTFVVSVRDVVEFLVRSFPREVLNLPQEGARGQRSREGA